MTMIILSFAIHIVTTAVCIWLASHMNWVKAQFKETLIIALLTSALALLPTIGLVASLALFIYLLVHMTNARFIDAVWVVMLSKLLTLLVLVVSTDTSLQDILPVLFESSWEQYLP